MALYCGIDLHSNISVLSLIDETKRLVSENRLDNNLVLIEHHLQPYQDEISGVVVESTFNWYWLVDGLMEHGNWVKSLICDRNEWGQTKVFSPSGKRG